MYSINLLKSIFSMNQSGKKVLTKDLLLENSKINPLK
jgi:hypothetical protein